MCLLINSRDDTYVAVIDNTQNKIVAMFSHLGCEGFILSHDREFIVTYSHLGSVQFDEYVLMFQIHGHVLEMD